MKTENLFYNLSLKLRGADIRGWEDISAFLSKNQISPDAEPAREKNTASLVKNGVAFITYDFGIDGVSTEIAKYASSIEAVYENTPVHFIGGDFCDKAENVIKPRWHRFRIEGMNGWAKWDGGRPFAKLFYEEMPAGSAISRQTAVEVWRQAVEFAYQLGDYLVKNNISILIPVNIPTNPGNFSINLAIIAVTEILGTYVLSSNHDFYWEGGKPSSEREAGESKGPRDHFFKNCHNPEFFSLFRRVYPWNGRRWIQVNINSSQSEVLTSGFGFPRSKVFELGTSVSDRFLEPYTKDDVISARRRMAYILSGGFPLIQPVEAKAHLSNLGSWMQNQKPVVCASAGGLCLDPAKGNTIYCLQPTRIIARKRITRNFQLIKALMRHAPFSGVFNSDGGDYQLVLHISGPAPIEHQQDLENVLKGYLDLVQNIPQGSAARIFLAFSVGNEDHPSLQENKLERLCIEEIYRMATVVFFPSETEGRGLPIVEAGACGIPIICSRYYPEAVFSEVVGENLSEGERIKYIHFPEGRFPKEFLDTAADILLYPEKHENLREHNRNAVRTRYGTEAIQRRFSELLEILRASG